VKDKFTPGPWKVLPAHHCIPGYHVCGQIVADTFTDRNAYDDPSEADQLLMAAAPELLEALRLTREALKRVFADPNMAEGDARQALALADIAIAKAEGECHAEAFHISD
jgi:hypothetical protein